MTVSEIDLFKVRKFCASRVPGQFLNEMRIESSARGHSVTILECRAPWDGDDTEWSRRPIAQLRYDPVALSWTLYWPDRNARWHLADFIKPGSVDDLLAEIEKDRLGIFWG
jgi:hypothetical protein